MEEERVARNVISVQLLSPICSPLLLLQAQPQLNRKAVPGAFSGTFSSQLLHQFIQVQRADRAFVLRPDRRFSLPGRDIARLESVREDQQGIDKQNVRTKSAKGR